MAIICLRFYRLPNQLSEMRVADRVRYWRRRRDRKANKKHA